MNRKKTAAHIKTENQLQEAEEKILELTRDKITLIERLSDIRVQFEEARNDNEKIQKELADVKTQLTNYIKDWERKRKLVDFLVDTKL